MAQYSMTMDTATKKVVCMKDGQMVDPDEMSMGMMKTDAKKCRGYVAMSQKNKDGSCNSMTHMMDEDEDMQDDMQMASEISKVVSRYRAVKTLSKALKK